MPILSPTQVRASASQSPDLPPLASAFVQAGLATVLMVLTGILFSLGVFVPAVEAASPNPGALDSVWPLAMGLMNLLSAPVMLFTSLLMERRSTQAVRTLSAVATVTTAMLTVAAVGISYSSPLIITVSLMALSVPFGVYNVLATELLAAWMPRNAYVAVLFAQGAFGLGATYGTAWFDRLLDHFTVTRIVAFSGVMLTWHFASITPMLVWPSRSSRKESRRRGEERERERLALRGRPDVRALSVNELVSLPAFWLYTMSAVTAGAGYVFVPYYVKLGMMFGVKRVWVIEVFQVACVMCFAVALSLANVTEQLRYELGMSAGVSLKITIWLKLIQTIMFLVICWAAVADQFIMFSIAACLLMTTVTAQTGSLAQLAEDTFGKENSIFVILIGTSAAFVAGETLSVFGMVVVDLWIANTSTPGAYRMFYIMATLWSGLGFACAIALKWFPVVFSRPGTDQVATMLRSTTTASMGRENAAACGSPTSVTDVHSLADEQSAAVTPPPTATSVAGLPRPAGRRKVRRRPRFVPDTRRAGSSNARSSLVPNSTGHPSERPL